MVALRRVFAAVEALAPVDRVELSRLLGEPGLPLSLLPADIARLTFPRQPSRRAALLELIERAVRGQIDGDLADWTLEEIVPGLGRITGRIDASPDATNRLVAVLHAHRAASWTSLAARRIGDVRAWQGAGPAVVSRLVRLAVAAAMGRHPAGHETREQEALFVDERASPLASAFTAVLGAVGDDRGVAVLAHGDLRLDAPLSPAEVADLLGVSYERTRQLRAAARRTVHEAGSATPLAADAAAALAGRLGEAAPRAAVEEALGSMGLGTTDTVVARLALWMAGPYLPVPSRPGWYSRQPAELLARTAGLLAAGGGVHDRRTLLDDLAHLGVAPESTEAWLDVQPVRREHDLVVYLVGRPASVAERALEATGRAMTTTELQRWLPDDDASVLPVALRRDRRFLETAPGAWELAEWGGVRSDQRVRMEVAVTHDVLAGRTGEAPPDLVLLLGLTPGSTQTFTSRFGPVTLTFDGHRVVRGSARPVALACGAVAGTTLVFSLDPGRAVAEVEVLTPVTSDEVRTRA